MAAGRHNEYDNNDDGDVDDGEIRVRGVKRQSFIAKVLKIKPRSDNKVEELPEYDKDEIKGRNPMEREAARKKKQAAADAARKKLAEDAARKKQANAAAAAKKASTAPKPKQAAPKPTPKPKEAAPKPAASKPKETFPNRNRSSSLAGRNPVDFDKANGYNKNKPSSNSNNRGGGDPLAGRNPVDFDKANGYGKNAKNFTDSDGIRVSSSSNSNKGNQGNPWAGRNPRDFDGCDPYGNPLNNKKNKDNLLDGRNPRDFGATDPYGNPLKNSEEKDDLTKHQQPGGCCHHCPHCKAQLVPAEEPKEDVPAEVDVETVWEEESVWDEETICTLGSVESPAKKEQPPTQDNEMDASEKRRLKLGNGKLPESKEPEEPYQIRGKIVHLDGSERDNSESVDLDHAETIKREIKKDIPVWARVQLKPTKRGSAIKATTTPVKKEKFSLPTYHQPRQLPVQN